jgi:outer membrane protein
LLVLLTTQCLSQTPEGAPLTLERCFALAQTRSESLRTQSDRQKEAGEHIAQARGALLPGLDFKYSKFFRDTVNDTVAGEGLDTRLEAVQPLFYGFRKIEAVGLAKVEKLREDFQYRVAVRRLYGDVAQIFYAIAEIESDIKNVRETMQLIQSRISELAERVRLGKSRDSEVLMTESQVAALRAQAEKLEGDRSKALETLAFLTGTPPDLLDIADTTPQVTRAEPLEHALAAVRQRSDVLVARQNVAQEESLVRIARGALLPTANLDGSWYTSRSGSLSGVDWDVYLFMNVPLFQGGALRSRVREESLRLSEARQQAELVARQTETEIRQLHHALESSLAQAGAYREAYDKAKRSYQSQMKDYRLGLVNNLDVLQAVTTLLSVKSSSDRSAIQVKLDKMMLGIATEIKY